MLTVVLLLRNTCQLLFDIVLLRCWQCVDNIIVLQLTHVGSVWSLSCVCSSGAAVAEGRCGTAIITGARRAIKKILEETLKHPGTLVIVASAERLGRRITELEELRLKLLANRATLATVQLGGKYVVALVVVFV